MTTTNTIKNKLLSNQNNHNEINDKPRPHKYTTWRHKTPSLTELHRVLKALDCRKRLWEISKPLRERGRCTKLVHNKEKHRSIIDVTPLNPCKWCGFERSIVSSNLEGSLSFCANPNQTTGGFHSLYHTFDDVMSTKKGLQTWKVTYDTSRQSHGPTCPRKKEHVNPQPTKLLEEFGNEMFSQKCPFRPEKSHTDISRQSQHVQRKETCEPGFCRFRARCVTIRLEIITNEFLPRTHFVISLWCQRRF